MGRARCTLKVRGLDCPVEANALRAALEQAPGVGTLGFDLIHGMMTVDYDPGPRRALGPGPADQGQGRDAGRPRRLAGGRRGVVVQARPVGRDGRLGPGPRWPGMAAGSSVLYGLAIAAGGVDLVPRAWRSLRHRRLDIHGLMLAAVVGAIALGQWDEAATVAFLFGLSESLEALSVDRARRAVRALLEVAPETAELIEARRGPDRARRRGRQGGSGPGPLGRAGPGGWVGRLGPVERRPEGHHRRVGRRAPRGRATPSSPARSTARGRWRSRRRARSTIR